VTLPFTDDLWSQPRLRRLCRLLRWCAPALIALGVFGVGLGAATLLRAAHHIPGGIAGLLILLAAATVVVAGPSVVDARRLEGRLRRLGLPGETPVDDEVDLSDDTLTPPVRFVAGPR
jgi:hypothetical protein